MATKRTAIVVDDSLSMRMVTSQMLESLRPEWKILVAKDAEDALAKSTDASLDFMLLDINMPGIDGFELGAKLAEQFPKASITMLTANVQQKVKDRAETRGFGFIEKPVTEEKLRAVVDDYDEMSDG